MKFEIDKELINSLTYSKVAFLKIGDAEAQFLLLESLKKYRLLPGWLAEFNKETNENNYHKLIRINTALSESIVGHFFINRIQCQSVDEELKEIYIDINLWSITFRKENLYEIRYTSINSIEVIFCKTIRL